MSAKKTGPCPKCGASCHFYRYPKPHGRFKHCYLCGYDRLKEWGDAIKRQKAKTCVDSLGSAKSRSIQLFNGRGQYRRAVSGEWVASGHIYIGAHSKADAVRVMHEAGFIDFTYRELNEYYNKGAWGTAMEGITPDRGVWTTPLGMDWTAHPPITRLV